MTVTYTEDGYATKVGHPNFFDAILLCNVPLSKLTPVYRDDHDQLRLYMVRSDEHGMSTSFIAIRWNCGDWRDGTAEIDVIFHGCIIFEGIRHMFCGEDGYWHYPELDKYIHCLNLLNAESELIIKNHSNNIRKWSDVVEENPDEI